MAKKNAQGKYRGRVKIGVNPDGTNKNKWASANTLAELTQKKLELREHYLSGTPIPEDAPFEYFAMEWYRTKKENRIAIGSRNSYMSAFNKHLFPRFGQRHLKAISADDIQEFINEYFGKSKSLINQLMSILRAVFDTATARGIVRYNPSLGMVPPIHRKKAKKRALTADEVKGSLKLMETHEHGDIIAVLYYLGVRRGEALGLKWGDFIWEKNLVHIRRDFDFVTNSDGELKTDNADRFIPIPESLRRMLYPKRGWHTNYVLHRANGEHYTQSTFDRAWLRMMIEIGCCTEREKLKNKGRKDDVLSKYIATLTPHYYRHNFITMMYKAKVDPLKAMKLAGHADYQTTADIYTHLNEEMLKQPMMDMEAIFADAKLMSQIHSF